LKDNFPLPILKTTTEQIDIWRAAKSEDGHLEFKEAKNNFNTETLLRYCNAIANERGGVLLLGVVNRPPRPVVGTQAFLNPIKISERLFNKLHFQVEVEEVQHPGGRVVVFHIPARPVGYAYPLDGAYYMRSGESLVTMSPDRLKRIFAEGSTDRPAANDSASVSAGHKIFSILTMAFLIVAVAGFLIWTRFQTSDLSNKDLAQFRRTWFLTPPTLPQGWDTKTPRKFDRTKSFPFVVPGVWLTTGAWDFIVNHRGPEPSFNVEIVFTDIVKREQILSKSPTFLTPEQMNSYVFTIKYPEIDPYGLGSLFAKQFQWAAPQPGHEKYAIEINWRDGSVHQELQIERVGKKWFWASQVTDRVTKTFLVNCKDKGFPYGPAGQKPCFPEMTNPERSDKSSAVDESHTTTDQVQADAHRSTRKEVLRDRIAALISEGTGIRDKAPVYVGTPVQLPGEPDILAMWTAWSSKVEQFLQRYFDAAEVARFRAIVSPDQSLNSTIRGEIADLEKLLDGLK
jgi:Putative DNA-binding domain